LRALNSSHINSSHIQRSHGLIFRRMAVGGDVRCYADLGLAGMNRRGHINCSLETRKDVSK